MKLVRLCEHGFAFHHYHPPDDTKSGAYVEAHLYIRCEGGTEFVPNWTAAYAAGAPLDNDVDDATFELLVERIVDAALTELEGEAT